MKKLIILLFCLFLAPTFSVQAVDKSYTNFITYNNSRFNYSISYPSFFTNMKASDNGDGISLSDDTNTYKLTVWGSYNINKETGHDKLNALLNEIAYVKDSYSEQNYYWAIWSNHGGKDGKEIFWYEYGMVNDDKIAVYRSSYPEDDQDYFEFLYGNNRFFKFGEEKNYMDLVFALAASELKASDEFNENSSPNWKTTNNVIYDLILSSHFAGNFSMEHPELGFGAHKFYFSRGTEKPVENSLFVPTSPNELYKNYFAKGTYSYPDSEYLFIGGTQMGIMVTKSAELAEGFNHPYIAVFGEKNEGDLKFIEIGFSRSETTPKAIVTLKKDSSSYFGWTILAYKSIN